MRRERFATLSADNRRLVTESDGWREKHAVAVRSLTEVAKEASEGQMEILRLRALLGTAGDAIRIGLRKDFAALVSDGLAARTAEQHGDFPWCDDCKSYHHSDNPTCVTWHPLKNSS